MSGRSQWTRRFLPGGTGTSVQARIPSEGRKRRTLVLVAHHDAAHGGWVWHPRTVAANKRRLATSGRALPSHLAPSVALLGAATPVRAVRLAAAAALAAGIGLFVQSARSPTAPGANDNATGVAALIELARRLSSRPLPGTEVVLLSPGGEESGTSGMAAWLRQEGAPLDRRSTLVVSLDSVGSAGELVVSRREGFTGLYRRRDLALVKRAAARAGQEEPRRIVFFNPTDACAARARGFPALSILSLADGWITNLHRPTDVPEHVSWDTVRKAIELTHELARVWAEGV